MRVCRRSWTSMLAVAFSYISVEPVIFLRSLADNTNKYVWNSLKIDKVCRQGANWFGDGTSYSDELCDELDNGLHPEEQDHVQTEANYITIAETYLKYVPAILFSIVAMAWADKHGRKPILLLSQVMDLLSAAFVTLNIIFYDSLSADWLVLAGLIRGLCGTTPIFYSLVSTMMADVASPRWLIVRLFFAQHMVDFIAAAIGSDLSSLMYQHFDFLGCYSLSIALYVVVVAYIAFMRETKQQQTEDETESADEKDDSDPVGCLGYVRFSLDTCRRLCRESYSFVRMRRPQLGRLQVLLASAGHLLSQVAAEAHYLDGSYLRKKFTWESSDEFNQWYPQFSALTTLCMIADTPAVLLFNSCLVRNLELICVFSVVSTVAMDQFFLMANQKELLYVGVAVGFFKQARVLGARLLLFALGDAAERARAMGVVTIIEYAAAMMVPLFDLIYNSTLDWHPGFVYCLASALNIAALIFYLAVHVVRRSFRNKNQDLKDT